MSCTYIWCYLRCLFTCILLFVGGGRSYLRKVYGKSAVVYEENEFKSIDDSLDEFSLMCVDDARWIHPTTPCFSHVALHLGSAGWLLHRKLHSLFTQLQVWLCANSSRD